MTMSHYEQLLSSESKTAGRCTGQRGKYRNETGER